MSNPVLPEGYRLLAFDEIDSTNEEARRQAAAVAGSSFSPLWIWAKTQTAGRGRRGRSWSSNAGNLFCTLLLDPQCDATKASELSFVTAVAVANALAGLGLEAQIKWPNDVLVDDAKICGVLLESASGAGSAAQVGWLAVGIGINLASHPEGLPYPATHVAAQLQADPPRAEDMLSRLAISYDEVLTQWRTQGFGAVRKAWLGRAKGVGTQVAARLGHEEVTGRFVDIDETGALLLELEDGAIRPISAGEVFFSAGAS